MWKIKILCKPTLMTYQDENLPAYLAAPMTMQLFIILVFRPINENSMHWTFDVNSEGSCFFYQYSNDV